MIGLDFERRIMIGLDYETFCKLDIRTVGLDNYVNDPTFRPLFASVAYNDGKAETFDFVIDGQEAIERFRDTVSMVSTIYAHNAQFEIATSEKLGISFEPLQVKDTAIIARCMGASSALEFAAPQLLDNINKLADGRRLIRKFSVGFPPQREDVLHDEDWEKFKKYGLRDAELALLLGAQYDGYVDFTEWGYALITHQMNRIGWPVDLGVVSEMQRRYDENREKALQAFRSKFDPDGELNFNSLKQLKEWCAERGVRARSFDEEHVADLLEKVRRKIADPNVPKEKVEKYLEVAMMLDTKQILGGSSLRKLKTILEMTGPDSRLRYQYMHVGAGQTYRTSGRGVQMQNLKRIGEPRDMSTLFDDEEEWTNDDLAANLRQVFTASRPNGALIVGDYSSIESRALAYEAGEDWKIQAYTEGKDLYKVLASKIYHVPYDAVTKAQRQTGKVGELSCGYGAGPGAVMAFAKGMGVELTEEEALSLVTDWRKANPNIVKLWATLEELLKKVVVETDMHAMSAIGNGMYVRFSRIDTPPSLQKQHPGAVSVKMRIYQSDGAAVLNRVFHGCYLRGRNVCYYKPSSVRSGPLWVGHYTDPKTKQRKFYDLYGGKLAGILTQSFCRQIFFKGLSAVFRWVESVPNMEVIGQFHDEIVVDWWPEPGEISLEIAASNVKIEMITAYVGRNFPLAAEVKADYRYTK